MKLDWSTRVGILCLLLSVYALFFVGQNQSKDEDWILSAASTFVRHGALHIESTAANEWGSSVFADEIQRAFAPDNAIYTKKGLAPSVAMMPLVLMADIWPRYWSTEATVLLLNPLVIGLTALLLAEVAATIGYSRPVAVVAAILYGVGTLALPYAQTGFGEPLVGLLLMATIWLVLAYQRGPSAWLALASGATVGVAIGVNPIYGLFTPVFGLWLLGFNIRRWRWLDGVLFGTQVLLSVAIMLAYNVLRFGDAFYSGYNLSTNEGFIHPVHWGVFGLMLSAYRGLLWYVPLTWLSFTGWRGLHRTHSQLAVASLGLILINLFGIASWWSWHGGVVWGPRFMVPVMPLFALFWLPALSLGLKRASVRWAILALAVVSTAIQVLGSLYNYNVWSQYLSGRYPGDTDNIATGLADRVMVDPQTSAIWGHLSYLFNGTGDLTPAIMRGASPETLLAHGAILFTLGALGVLLLQRRVPLWLAAPAAALAILILPVLYPHPAHSRALAVGDAAEPGGIVFAITDEKWLERVGDNLMISAHAPTAPDHPYARTRWGRAISWQPSKPFWLLTWFPAASPENWQEQFLWEQHAYVSETWVDDNRLLRFDRRPIASERASSSIQMGQISLVATGTTRHDNGFGVALTWQALANLEADYVLFVHFLDADGNIIHQVDRVPLGGFYPTTDWREDDEITTRFFAPTPDAVSVRTGWRDAASGELLGGPGVPEGFVVIPLTEATR